MGIGAKCYFRAKSPLFDASSQYKCVTHLPGQTAQFVREFAKCEMSSNASIINHELAGHSVERAPRPLLAKNESERIQCGSSVFLFLCLRKSGNKEPRRNKKNRAQREREVVLLVLQECKMLNVVHMAVYSWFHIFRTTPTAHHCWQKILPLCVCVCFLRMRKSLGHPHTHTLTRWSPILFFCSARSFLHWTFGCTKTNFFPAASL